MHDNKNIRIAISEDSRRIWEIRNHPDVRKKSGNSEIIAFNKHDNWFNEKYFVKNDNICYVLTVDNEVAGYCRLDLDKNNYVISIAVDSAFHGKGLGNFLLNQTLQKYNKSKSIIADIKKDNIISIKLFERNGFEYFAKDEENFHYSYNNK